VDGQVRGDAARALLRADVLDDERVDARRGGLADGALKRGQLLVKDEDVEGEVALDAPRVQVGRHLGQILGRKVGGARARVEARRQAEKDGVGAVLDRGPELRPAARGREHLWLLSAQGRGGVGVGGGGGEGRWRRPSCWCRDAAVGARRAAAAAAAAAPGAVQLWVFARLGRVLGGGREPLRRRRRRTTTRRRRRPRALFRRVRVRRSARRPQSRRAAS
jgi:hypothetical protein